MASLLTITNLTRSRISIDSSTSSLAGLETRTIEVTVEELEKMRHSLTAFAASSIITWDVVNDAQQGDGDAQFVTLEDVLVGVSTSSTLDLYVSAANGNDINDGSRAYPLKTYAAAVAKIPSFVKHTVTIHLAPHPGDGYDLASIENKSVSSGATIHVTGDDNFNVLVAPTGALIGSSDVSVEAAALPVDAYIGKTIEILTGAAAGDRRSIRNNTATSIVPVEAFTAPVATGDSYQIVEPAVVISLSSVSLGTPDPDGFLPAVSNCPGMTDTLTSSSSLGNYGPPSVVFSNLQLAAVTPSSPSAILFPFSITNSSVAFYGVSLFSSSSSYAVQLLVDVPGVLMSGVDHVYYVPQSLFPFSSGLAPAQTSWSGWGTRLPSSGFVVSSMRRFIGYICATKTLFVDSGIWRILGGSFNSDSLLPGQSGALVVGGFSNVTLESFAAPKILIRSTQDGLDRCCLDCALGATVELHGTILEKTNQGCGISAEATSSGQGGAPAFIGVNDSVEIRGVTGVTAPTYGMLVYIGGVIHSRSDVAMSGWPAGQEIAVRTRFGGAGVTIEADDFSALTTNGSSLPSVGVADGRYGWIRRM